MPGGCRLRDAKWCSPERLLKMPRSPQELGSWSRFPFSCLFFILRWKVAAWFCASALPGGTAEKSRCTTKAMSPSCCCTCSFLLILIIEVGWTVELKQRFRKSSLGFFLLFLLSRIVIFCPHIYFKLKFDCCLISLSFRSTDKVNHFHENRLVELVPSRLFCWLR